MWFDFKNKCHKLSNLCQSNQDGTHNNYTQANNHEMQKI